MFNGLLDAETIDVLIYLSPGVVSVGVLYSLQPQLNKGGITVAFQALIFALSTNFLVGLFPDSWGIEAWRLLVGWGIAVVLSGVVVVIIRFDLLHRLLRKSHLTDQQPAFPGPWDAAYARHQGYVAVRFKGSVRTVVGFPEHWDDRPNGGWIKLVDVRWVGGSPDYLGGTEVEFLLIRVDDLDSPVTFVKAGQVPDAKG